MRGVREAFRRGAKGVEIDIIFDSNLGDFVVSHHSPYVLFDKKPLMLRTVLSEFQGRGLFWLDAKNLGKLAPSTAYGATKLLSDMLKMYRLADRSFVESSNPLYLSWLASRDIYTSLAVHLDERKYGKLAYLLNVAAMKLAYVYVGSGAVSMGHSRYTPTTAAAFEGAPVLLSTVNDPEALQRLSTDTNVKVLLSDDDHYYIDACALAEG